MSSKCSEAGCSNWAVPNRQFCKVHRRRPTFQLGSVIFGEPKPAIDKRHSAIDAAKIRQHAATVQQKKASHPEGDIAGMLGRMLAVPENTRQQRDSQDWEARALKAEEELKQALKRAERAEEQLQHNILPSFEGIVARVEEPMPWPRKRVAFLFEDAPMNMVPSMFESEMLFVDCLRHCGIILQSMMQCNAPLLAVMNPDEDQTLMQGPKYERPAAFAFQYALAQLWISKGIVPHAVMGLGAVGELLAAHFSGALSLSDALKLVVLLSTLPASPSSVFEAASKTRKLSAHLDEVELGGRGSSTGATHDAVEMMYRDQLAGVDLGADAAGEATAHSTQRQPRKKRQPRKRFDVPSHIHLVCPLGEALGSSSVLMGFQPSSREFWLERLMQHGGGKSMAILEAEWGKGLQALRSFCGCSIYLPIAPGSQLDPTAHADSLSHSWWTKNSNSDKTKERSEVAVVAAAKGGECEWHTHALGVPSAAVNAVFDRVSESIGRTPAATSKRGSALLGFYEIADLMSYSAISTALYALT